MKQLRKILSLLCALTMVLTFLSIPALAEETAFAGGSGTADAPWQIASVDQLAYLAATVHDGSKSGYMGAMGAYFVLTADLDMTGAQARWAEFAANPGAIMTDAVIAAYSEAENVEKLQPQVDAFIA